MYRHSLFITWFSLLVLIAVLHSAAIAFYIYWSYLWFDNVMHFLGGLFVALSTLWFFYESGYVEMSRNTRHVILLAASATVLISVGWEVFEYLVGAVVDVGYAWDTTSDLCMDALGSSVGTLYVIRSYIQKHDH